MLQKLIEKIRPLVNSTTISQADVDKLALTKEEQAKFLACYHHIVNQFKLEEVQAAIAAKRQELAELLGIDEGLIEVKEDGTYSIKEAIDG